MKNILKIISIITLALFSITGINLVFKIVKLNMISTKFICIGIVALILLMLLVILLLTRKNKVLKIGGNVLGILLSIIFIVGSIFVSKSNDNLKKLFSESLEESIYYVLVTDENYNNLDKIKNQKVGILKNNASNVKKYFEDYKYQFREYNVIGELTDSLLLESDNNIALIVDSNVYESIEIIDETLFNKLIKVYEFKLAVDKEDAVQTEVIEEVEKSEELSEEEQKMKDEGFKKDLLKDVKKGNSYIVYISGLDGGGTVRAYGLSDVNMLAVVNPDTHKVLLVSTPRDYYVQVAGTTGLKDKLTHAGLYGINASIGTMNNLYGIKIDYYAKVTFGAITALVDDIGGIDVYSDTAFNSYHKKGWYVVQGMNHMDGEKALAYARERYAYAGGDRHRIKNQQDVITAIINKVSKDPQQLMKFNDILNDIDPYFTTNVPYEKMQAMVKNQMNTLSGWNVESISVNGTNSNNVTASWPNQYTYVMIPTLSTIVTAQQRIAAVMEGR